MRKKVRWRTLFAMVLLAVSITACQSRENQTAGSDSDSASSQIDSRSRTQGINFDTLETGDTVSGFTLKEIGSDDTIGAKTFSFEHEKSGADLLFIKNDDPNLGFAITYRTPHVDETDANHVFEHAVIASSGKYPSKDVTFDMMGKTYSTYVNASTYLPFTTYPVCSQSQEQLEKMADVYLSCMVDPEVLEDERFFKREAVRYELRKMDDPITISGTVYSEDFGQLTSTDDGAFRNLLRALYPGEIASNMNRMAHINYRDLNYEHTIETYDRYYHFDNSLIILYGDMDGEAFLKFLDEDYLSKAEKNGTDLRRYQDGETEPGYVEEVVYSPAYEGDSTEHASFIYYAADLSEDSWEQFCQYHIIGQMLSGESSVLCKNLRDAGISDPVEIGMAMDIEKPMFYFGLLDTEEDKAPIFKEIIDKTLAEICQSGLEQEWIDAVLKSKEISDYTAMENTNIFPDDLIPNISTKWALHGQTDALQDWRRALQNLKADEDQTLIKRFADRFLNAERKAMVTTVPKPGMAEEIEQKQADELKKMKASMTEEELEQMIADTLAFDQWNASELANSDFTIAVEDLPDPEPYATVHVKDLSGITSYTSPTELEKISSNRIYLDTGSVKQEDLHYITLYAMLAAELGTERYEKTEMDSLRYQYLSGLTFESVYPPEYAEENHRPMLSASWYGLAEDYRRSLELLVEMLSHTDLTDKAEIEHVLDKGLPSSDQSRADPLILARDIALSATDMNYRYKDYVEGQPFYEFTMEVQERLETEPSYYDEFIEKLTSVRDLILRKDRLIVMNAAASDELDAMERISEEVLGRLPSLKAAPESYDIPKPEQYSAVIVEAPSQSHVEMAAIENPEDFPGRYFPFISAISDRYIVPQIRFQGNAYSAAADFNMNMRYVFAYSSSDPKVKETIDIIAGQADYLEDMELTQEELDDYITSTYGIFTSPYGSLERHMKAMEYQVSHFDTDGLLTQISQVREARIEDQATAAAALRALLKNATYVVTGNRNPIMENKECFDVVTDYRQGMEVKYHK